LAALVSVIPRVMVEPPSRPLSVGLKVIVALSPSLTAWSIAYRKVTSVGAPVVSIPSVTT
jgi:hypothetical protein